MATVASRSVPSPPSRRVHYQGQYSNGALASSQNYPPVDSLSLNESFCSSFANFIPLVTVIYSTISASKAVNPLTVRRQNQQLLLNSYASCHRLLDHIRPLIGVQNEEVIDLMDTEGKLKELNTHGEEYASQYLTGRSTYYVLKIENDLTVGEKRYTPSFNLDQVDSKLYTTLSNALMSLNKSLTTKTKRNAPATKQNTPAQQNANTAQTKLKRTSSRK